MNRIEELAKRKGISMAQVGIAWQLAKDHVTAPIVGTSKFENLTDIIGAWAVDYLLFLSVSGTLTWELMCSSWLLFWQVRWM